MVPIDLATPAEYYDDYPRIEEAFQTELDESLEPRGPEMLYEMVGALGLTRGASALDLGCGEGRYSLELAARFGFSVLGVDPTPRQVEVANEAQAAADAEVRKLVRFEEGASEAIPAEDASVDLIWCREVLYHVPDLDTAFAECLRVLRRGGHMLVYMMFATDRLEPREAERLWKPLKAIQANTDAQYIESAFTRAGFRIAERVEIGTEWGERFEEESGAQSRRLIHAARLLRAPERYIAQFGQLAYDIMLQDCMWHVYRMIGKLSPRIYLLKSP
jgi:ubiquinone/menaquinone biosynthesis C-methylase UbiE